MKKKTVITQFWHQWGLSSAFFPVHTICVGLDADKRCPQAISVNIVSCSRSNAYRLYPIFTLRVHWAHFLDWMWFGLHSTPRGSTDVKRFTRMHISYRIWRRKNWRFAENSLFSWMTEYFILKDENRKSMGMRFIQTYKMNEWRQKLVVRALFLEHFQMNTPYTVCMCIGDLYIYPVDVESIVNKTVEIHRNID